MTIPIGLCQRMLITNTSPPPRGVHSIVMSVSIGLSRGYLKNHLAIFTKYLCMLFIAVARFSSGSVAIRYALPVLWMTSCFHIIGLRRAS